MADAPTEIIADTASPDFGGRRLALEAYVGTVLLGRFELVEFIGQGGMSGVYKAVDRRKVEGRADDPHVAVKLLALSFADHSAALAVLQREAAKLQSLAHPNIVRAIDCDRDGEIVFMTMEYLEGESLAKKLAGSKLPASEALAILEGVASALAFAHGQGILHGDFKPGNVLVSRDGEVKVIDFAIARAMAPFSKGRISDHRHGWGNLRALTPAYASPEMLEGGEADARDDIYALGCVTHELFTGEHPFNRLPATEARDSRLALKRHPALTRRQFKALEGALQLSRNARTPSVARFLQEFRGRPAPSSVRWAWLGAAAAVALVAIVLFSQRSPPPALDDRPSPPAPGPGEVFRDCPTCPLMTVVPAGKFEQGAAAGRPQFEQPRHAVAIAAPFGMGVHEVTVGEYAEFAEATRLESPGCATYEGEWRVDAARGWRDPGFPQTSAHPATCVSWLDAVAYAAWLSQKSGHAYRLPTASEWEYAARGGADIETPWGADAAAACRSANVADAAAARRYPGWTVQPCSDGFVYSAPVGSFTANAFGLKDTLGNVFEWVEDCWFDDYSGAPADGSARTGGACTERELRGGSWFTTPEHLRAQYRNRFEPGYRSSSIGFRVVRDIE
ncbi:MAG: bifunctional serine/threonine-protein kinase/formylglycine-generating enzyme family protein [Steroidobacteraceae bacterium]